jgi:hypothetical protein
MCLGPYIPAESMNDPPMYKGMVAIVGALYSSQGLCLIGQTTCASSCKISALSARTTLVWNARDETEHPRLDRLTVRTLLRNFS